ncbi:MAG: hypothetical protein ACXVBH_02900 [Flavisolibacter sp.]
MTIVKKTDVETVEIYKVIKHGFNNPSLKELAVKRNGSNEGNGWCYIF